MSSSTFLVAQRASSPGDTTFAYIDVFEPIIVAAMGVCLFALGFRLYKNNVMRLPAAIALAIAGALAIAWKYPDLAFLPDSVRLPFVVAEVQFFVALSICMTLFALDVFTAQARALAGAEEALRRQTAELEKAAVIQQMAAIVDSSDDAIIGQRLDGRITSWNVSAERIFGYPADEVRGSHLGRLVDTDHQTALQDALENAAAGRKVVNHETVCVRSNGAFFDATMTLAPIRDAVGGITGVSCVARDVSEMKRSEELRKLALTDELTGLNNRRGFLAMAEHRAEQAVKTGEAFKLLFLDLNGLKKVNDNFGHAEGDRYITDAAEVLRSTFRDTDVLARVGGDEFCVLLSGDASAVDTDSPVSRLQAMMDIRNLQSGRPYKLSMSIGLATFDPYSPMPIEHLMKVADESMYEQKFTGRARYRVLVCDDDPSICSLLEVVLSDTYDVETTLSGKDLLKAAADRRPDLILLDLNLPDMHGTEVAKELRADPKTKLTPIIMITGAGDNSSEIESLRAGVDDYVEKPFDEDALIARMENVIKRSVRR